MATVAEPQNKLKPRRRVGRIILLGFLGLLGVLVVVICIFLFIVPSPINAIAWNAPVAPRMEGVLAPNDELRKGELIAPEIINGAEDIAVDAQGRLYVGSLEGIIRRVTFGADGKPQIEVFADTNGGHPIDMIFDRNGNLIVADWKYGLVSYNPAGQMSVIIPIGKAIEDEKFMRPDGIAVGSDGTYYVSLGSVRNVPDPIQSWLPEIFEQKPYGRFISYNPATGASKVLIRDLYFGNGVALAPDESFVLVASQFRYQILRYWLKGDKAGTYDIFAENLPGFVHNIHYNADGTLWAALNTRRVALVDNLHPQPFLKNQLAKLPESLLRGAGGASNTDTNAPGLGLVVALNKEGQITRSLQNPPFLMNTVSSAIERNNYLYVSSLEGKGIIRYKL
jgi:hypothetical protein